MAFQGTLVSQFAKLHLDNVVDELNDDTLDTWAELQAESQTDLNCPMSPFMEKELLRDTDLSLDGSAFMTTVGYRQVLISMAEVITKNYRYKHPKITVEEVKKVIESYKKLNWWP